MFRLHSMIATQNNFKIFSTLPTFFSRNLPLTSNLFLLSFQVIINQFHACTSSNNKIIRISTFALHQQPSPSFEIGPILHESFVSPSGLARSGPINHEKCLAGQNPNSRNKIHHKSPPSSSTRRSKLTRTHTHSHVCRCVQCGVLARQIKT